MVENATTKDVVVQGVTFRIALLDFEKGAEVYAWLLSKLGAAGGSLGGSKEAMDILAALLSTLKPEDLKYLLRTFVPTTVVVYPDGKTPTLEHAKHAEFQGKYLKMTLWLKECLTFNFADFSSGALEQILGGQVQVGTGK